jgi:hypothetical protein
VLWHGFADLYGARHLAALIGDRAGGLGGDPHPIDRHLVGVRIARAILRTDPHTDAVRNALRGMVNHRLFEAQPLGAAILEVKVGVIGLALEGATEDSFERAFIHPKSVQEKLVRLD